MANSPTTCLCLAAFVSLTVVSVQAQEERLVPSPDDQAGFVQVDLDPADDGSLKDGDQQGVPDSTPVETDTDLEGDLEMSGGDGGIDSFLDASLDSLASTQVAPDLNFEVTSVARDETPIGRSPAAIFVITNEMIQRSGARTLQDALRMVPGMHVARQVNGVFAIGMRGNAASNLGDMLVQVDGRSIYNRTFGGTFWGSQEFVLEDIERVEIIRGPGASVWGANFRNTTMQLQNTFTISATGDRDLQANEYGVFVQDTIALDQDVDLTVGTKLSYNDFSQFEHQPSARIVWNPTSKLSVWGGVSWAVATPNFGGVGALVRTAPSVTAPPGPFTVFPRLTFNPDIHAEDLLAVEAGIRGQPSRDVYWDLAAYHFNFRDRAGVGAPAGLVPSGFPGVFDLTLPRVNLPGTSEVAGFEFFGKYNVDEHWRLSGNYSYAHNFDAGYTFPKNSVYLQSSHDLAENLELDLIFRYRDTFGAVDSYNTGDVRLSWQMTDSAVFTLAGVNLFSPAHAEDGNLPTTGTFASATQRAFYGMIQLRY